MISPKVSAHLFWLMSPALLAVDFSGSLQTRAEYLQGAKPLAARLIAKPKARVVSGNLSLNAEAFSEWDATDKLPYRDDERLRAHLDEVYAEWSQGALVLRLGQQALRWSESWALPSLDYWTARRYDRLFADPLEDQLKHSTGLLSRFTSESFDLDLFGALRLAENDLPQGYNQPREEWELHGGVRAKIRQAGFDLSPTYARLREKDHWGFGLSYAFENVVPKFEFGSNEMKESFYTAGFDLFWGDFNFFPQITFSRIRSGYFERMLYLPLRFSFQKHAMAFETFVAQESRDLFHSLSYFYDLSEHWQISTFFQNYDGLGATSLLRYYRGVAQGWVTGFRLQSDLGFD
jgi:hypothetical protein